MGISAELNAVIRERCEYSVKLPAKYMRLKYGFRLSEADGSNNLVLYREDKPQAQVLMGRIGRDGWGRRWFLNPGWRNETKALVVMLGMEQMEEISEEITW